MLSTRKRKGNRKRGFILIYVLFACSLCLFIVLGIYKMEVLIRSNNLNFEKRVIKVDNLQKTREYLLTELDENICKNVSTISDSEVKIYLSSISDFNLKYNDSCVKYNKNNNCFLIQYYINHKFYKEELYEYKIINGSVFYGCIDYSFKQGGIK